MTYGDISQDDIYASWPGLSRRGVTAPAAAEAQPETTREAATIGAMTSTHALGPRRRPARSGRRPAACPRSWSCRPVSRPWRSCSSSCVTLSCASPRCGCASWNGPGPRVARRSRTSRSASAIRAMPRSRRARRAARSAADYEIWISDGDLVRTYAGAHKPRHAATDPEPAARSRRPRLPGLRPGLRAGDAAADRDAARTRSSTRRASARTCWRPAAASVTGTAVVDRARGDPARLRPSADDRARRRPARTSGSQLAVDRDDRRHPSPRRDRSAATSRRDAEVVRLDPDAPLPPSAFEFVFPTGTTMLY